MKNVCSTGRCCAVHDGRVGKHLDRLRGLSHFPGSVPDDDYRCQVIVVVVVVVYISFSMLGLTMVVSNVFVIFIPFKNTCYSSNMLLSKLLLSILRELNNYFLFFSEIFYFEFLKNAIQILKRHIFNTHFPVCL